MRQPREVFSRLYPLSVLILTITLICSMISCSRNSDGNPRGDNEGLIPSVEAVQARFGSLPLTERLSGVVKAMNQVELYPQVSAPVAQVYVQNGNLVQSGDPLVRLRDTEFREQLKQAEANYQIALAQAKQAEAELKRMQSELQRSRDLAEKELISPTEMENIETQAIAAEASAELARARVEQAQATIDERKETLSRTVVRAPVDGTIGNRNAEVGMLVTPSTRLFTLGQLDTVRVEVVLTDRMLGYIEEGQRAEILSQNIPSGPISAPIARISPFLHPTAHSTVAEIDLVNPDKALKSGMFVTVDIFYGESQQATLVPLSALWENPATSAVGLYVSHDSLISGPKAMIDVPHNEVLTDPVSFEFVPVRIIAKGRMNAGIQGIDPGSWVVTIGQDLIGPDSGQARVRPVNWEWVEKLQRMQREDLLEEILQRQKTGPVDTSSVGMLERGSKDTA